MDLESEADDEGENREEMSSLEYFEPEDFKCPLEPEADDESTEEMSLEYFEPEDFKCVLSASESEPDPIIEISSDSEEESGPSQSQSVPTPSYLLGLNERRQSALLEGRMFPREDSVGHVPDGPSRPKEVQGRNQSDLLQEVLAKRPKRKKASSVPTTEEPPCPASTSTSRFSSSEWTVETVGNQHFIPCPECRQRVHIAGRSSLTDHIARSHPDKTWDPLKYNRHCQLCLPWSRRGSPKYGRFLIYEISAHVSTKHKINLSGPVASNTKNLSRPVVPNTKEIKCPECQMTIKRTGVQPELNNARALLDHLKTAHGMFKRPITNVWMVLSGTYDSFVKCKECADTIVRISNLARHFSKCHPGAEVDGGSCGRCNRRVLKKDLQAHLNCSPPVGVDNLRVEHHRPIPNLVNPAGQPTSHPSRKPSDVSSNIESPSTSRGKRKGQQLESEISPEKRARIVKEVLEERITISEIAKKYNRSVDSIRGWVREAAGHQLPESCKRFQFFLLLKNALCIILQY